MSGRHGLVRIIPHSLGSTAALVVGGQEVWVVFTLVAAPWLNAQGARTPPRTKSRRLDHFLATNRPWAGKHSAGETRERVDWQITVTRPLIVKYSVLTRTTIGCCVSGNPKPAQPRRNGPRDGQRCKKLALIRVGSKYPECLISYCGTYGT